ncbi:MAG: type IX secretion system membrane protein PorP/SprF [Bacteroidetes bacterium]|nr:type IX secretion system membrane protein PorP/SprF [Bacteroidota bacterium]MDA1269525.1 type IX secretion system membrane protein PorP/SprF [Bacteroidota bacterium]
MRKLLLWVFFLFLIPRISWGQDVQYSQYYANPIYLNPALVGSTSMTRLGFNFRNQWPALDQTFLAYTAYLDHFEERYNSGFAVIFQGANESFTETSWNEVGLGYSYRLQLSEESFLQAGMQGSFISRDAYFGRVVLGSQLDIDRGSIDFSGGGFAGESQVRDLDAHAGLMYYGRRAWLGASLGHLLRPDISYLVDGMSRLPKKLSVHGGYRFSLAPGYINDYYNNIDQERSFSVGFNYKQQGGFSQLDLGTEFFFEPLALGIWYRGLPTKYGLPNHESLVAMLGVSLDSGLDVGYSFDFPISTYSLGRSGGSHELSVRYVFSSQLPGGKRYKPLPSFRY